MTANPIDLGAWLSALTSVRHVLTAPLGAIFRDKNRPEAEHRLATYILAKFAADDPVLVTDVLMDADPQVYKGLFAAVESQADQALPRLQAELDKTIDGLPIDVDKDLLAERQARAAVALIRLRRSEVVWPLLRYSSDPRLRSSIVNLLMPLGADPMEVAAELDRTATSRSTQSSAAAREKPSDGPMKAILFDADTSKLRALILALGDYPASDIPPETLEPLITKLRALYRDDPDAGIHGSTEWTLRQWKQAEKLKAVDAELRKLTAASERRWFVNGEGQSFVLIEGPVQFQMGSPLNEPGRNPVLETPRQIRIPRRFALAAKEVTVDQFQRFISADPSSNRSPTRNPSSSSPARARTGPGSARTGTPRPLIAVGSRKWRDCQRNSGATCPMGPMHTPRE